MKRTMTVLLAALLLPLSALAATPQQMEQARAVVFRTCLRYMNNGSGYLDDQGQPKSVEELERNVSGHDKEKANLARLRAIRIPSESEYASWGRGEFDKFWTVTFMDQVHMESGASAARGQVAKKVSAITVSVVEPKKVEPAEEPKEEAKPDEGEESRQEEPAGGAEDIVDAAPAVTTADSVLVAGPEGAANNEQQSRDDGSMASIIVLCILVLVVVGLVVYALNVMRRAREEQDPPTPRQVRRAPMADDTTVAAVRHESPRAQRQSERSYVSQADMADESAFASYAAPEPPAPARDERDREIERLRAEIDRLRHEGGEQHREEGYRPGSQRGAAPRPRVIYLGRANAQGVFTRADASFKPGASVFKLVTTDGVSGTYQVVDDTSVFDMALSDPMQYLESACTGRNLQLSAGASTIITEAAGTAIFDQGRWRVTRKAQVRYSR